MNEQTQAPEKPHISATQLGMYWRCPESYRRRYVEGEVIAPAIALLQGRAFHKGAEFNFRQKMDSHKDLPASDIVDAAAAAFDTEAAGGFDLTKDEAFDGAEKALGQAKDLVVKLARCHAWEQAPDYQPVAVEHRSRILFPSATHDLVAITDLRDDKGRVVDFKTAARKLPTHAADKSTQLSIYAAAFQIETGRPPREVRLDVVTKTKTPARQVLRSHRSEAAFRVLINRVNATLDAINKGSFPPASPDDWCCSLKWCGYARTCPYFNSERNGDT